MFKVLLDQSRRASPAFEMSNLEEYKGLLVVPVNEQVVQDGLQKYGENSRVDYYVMRLG